MENVLDLQRKTQKTYNPLKAGYSMEYEMQQIGLRRIIILNKRK